MSLPTMRAMSASPAVLTIRTSTTLIGYLDEGPRDGFPVMLLHGFPDSPAGWDEVVAALPDDLRVIRPYLRGCGPTLVIDVETAGGTQVAALARDVLDLADGLGLERFLLVGHDWGARAAHAVAVLAPDRLSGLITMSTAYGPMRELSAIERFDHARAGWYRWWLCTEQGERAFRDAPFDLVDHAYVTWSPGFRLMRREAEQLDRDLDNEQFVDHVVHYFRHRSGVAPGAPRYVQDQALLDEWPKIWVPTTFLYGVEDQCEIVAESRGNADMFAASYIRAELSGVGHFIAREAPNVVASAIKQYL
jgi:pimeloyl-ACP methyl ester carboxylesterase